MSTLRIIILGDIVGASGRAMFQKHILSLRTEYKADAVIVNGENSAQGKGITPKVVQFFKDHGVNMITSGNHIWRHKEIYSYLAHHDDLIRPANFPHGCPGKGSTVFHVQGFTIGVLNLQGRVFMRELVDCPFRTADSHLTFLKSKTNIIIVDMHAETTSEKLGLAYYLDGRVSAVVGTHTHIQTADNRVLPKGTAYITDLGMAGSLNSMIGMKKEPIIENYLTQMPQKFTVDTQPPMVMSGVVVHIDTVTGHAINIERIYRVDHDIHVDQQD